jgi:hypothetical protein
MTRASFPAATAPAAARRPQKPAARIKRPHRPARPSWSRAGRPGDRSEAIDIIRDRRGVKWVWDGATTRLYGIPAQSMSVWSRHGCPPLGGRKVRPWKVLVTHDNPECRQAHWRNYYRQKELRKIASKIKRANDDRRGWLTAKECSVYGFHPSTIRRYARQIHPVLGRMIATSRKLVFQPGFVYRTLTVYSEADVKELAQLRRQPPAQHSKSAMMTDAEIFEFGIRRSQLDVWRKQCHHLPHGKLTECPPRNGVTVLGHARTLRQFLRSEIEIVKRTPAAAGRIPHRRGGEMDARRRRQASLGHLTECGSEILQSLPLAWGPPCPLQAHKRGRRQRPAHDGPGRLGHLGRRRIGSGGAPSRAS